MNDGASFIMHSGAGRIGRIRMHPMSLAESGDSTGQVSLAAVSYTHLATPRLGGLTSACSKREAKSGKYKVESSDFAK